MSSAIENPGVGGLCTAVFYLDRAFHLSNRDKLNDQVEHGGVAEIDWKQNKIGARVNGELKGGYDYIDLKRGLIDWHSHPNKCKSRDVCALGLPSPSDMRNVFVGIISGSLGHLVYGKEGTYVIQLEPNWLKRVGQNLKHDRVKLRQAAEEVERIFVGAYDQYMNSNVQMGYTAYRQLWLKTCKSSRFRVTFFAGDRLPYFRSCFRCNLRNGPPSTQFIDMLID
jgi:hypothetical protein